MWSSRVRRKRTIRCYKSKNNITHMRRKGEKGAARSPKLRGGIGDDDNSNNNNHNNNNIRS